jgi:hypothetical protein
MYGGNSNSITYTHSHRHSYSHRNGYGYRYGYGYTYNCTHTDTNPITDTYCSSNGLPTGGDHQHVSDHLRSTGDNHDD